MDEGPSLDKSKRTKEVKIRFSWDEWPSVLARQHKAGFRETATYLRTVEARTAELDAFKAQKCMEIAYDLRKWGIHPDLVLEAYRRL